MKCRVETIEMGVVPFASCAHRARLSRRSIVILIDRSLLPPNVSVSESVLSSFTTSATSSPALSTPPLELPRRYVTAAYASNSTLISFAG